MIQTIVSIETANLILIPCDAEILKETLAGNVQLAQPNSCFDKEIFLTTLVGYYSSEQIID